MANKKAKSKTTTKSPVNKRTTTRVVTADAIKSSDKNHSSTSENYVNRFVNYLLTPSTIKMMIVELIGTFSIAVTFMLTKGHPGYVMIAVVAAYAGLSTSTNGFFNPALSIAAFVNRTIFGMKAGLQIIAQVLGGMLALVTMQTFVDATKTAEASLEQSGLLELSALPAGKEWYIFAAELVGALILGLMLARAIKSKQTSLEKSFTLGGTTFIALLMSSSAAGLFGSEFAVINPAFLSTIKAFPSDNWQWIVACYILAPMVGAVIGFFIGSYITSSESTRVRKI